MNPKKMKHDHSEAAPGEPRVMLSAAKHLALKARPFASLRVTLWIFAVTWIFTAAAQASESAPLATLSGPRRECVQKDVSYDLQEEEEEGRYDVETATGTERETEQEWNDTEVANSFTSLSKRTDSSRQITFSVEAAQFTRKRQ